MSRFSRGDRPLSQALRACTISASTPAASTVAANASSASSGSCSSMPMRHFTVTGIATARLHRRDAIADQRRLRHQAGAEAALLHAVRRAADIEIDLVDSRSPRRCARTRASAARIAAAELQRDRMLGRIEAEQPRAVAVQHRAGGHHLGIEQRAARQQAMEEPAMPVGPFHHRRNGSFSINHSRPIFGLADLPPLITPAN